MKKCLREKCPNEFEPNKPKQVFCSAKCRVYFKREKDKDTKVVGVPLPKDYMEVKNIGVLSADGSVKPLFEPDFKIPVSAALHKSLSEPVKKAEVHFLTLSEYEQKITNERIEVLKKEIAKPPEKMSISKKLYLKVRQDELSELENKIKNV